MEEMMRKFKEEFKNVYYMLLDVSGTVDSLTDKDDNETCFDVWCRYKRKAGQAQELYRVAKILGYTQEEIDNWKEEVYNEYKKNNI